MAFTVVADLTDFYTAESITGVTATSAALDPDYFVQGSNSVTWNATKNGRRSFDITTTAQNWEAYTDPHLYFWISSSVAAKMENKTTGTVTASGVTVRVTLANNAYREWHVAGADTWAGEWKCFCIDMSHTGSQLYASSGTFSGSNMDQVTIYEDLTNSGNIRNSVNSWVDVIRVGEGLTAYNTSAADASFDLADIAADDETTANRYGVLENRDGIIYCQGRLKVGDSAGTNHLDFVSKGEVLVFKENNGSGYGNVASALYGLEVESNSTGTDQHFEWGTIVGSGDNATGYEGLIIRAGGPTVDYFVDLDASSQLHTMKIHGGAVIGATGGVYATGSPATTFQAAGVVFDGCGQIDLGDCNASSHVVLRTTEAATSGAYLWTEGETEIGESLFASNLAAIYIPSSLTADLDLQGVSFSDNTNDIRYDGTADFDVFLDEAIAIDDDGSLTQVVSPTTVTVHCVTSAGANIEGARVLLLMTGVGIGDRLPYDDTVTLVRSGTTATATLTGHDLITGDKVLISGAEQDEYNGVFTVTVATANTFTYTMSADPGASGSGTIKCTFVILDGTTAANGEITMARTFPAVQPAGGRARKGSTTPYYKSATITNQNIPVGGSLTYTVQMTEDA